MYNASGLEYYRHPDWLGSSRFSSTPTRTMYNDLVFASFGEPYAQSGSADTSFTGQNQNAASNLYDFMYREYGIQGRWPSPDPAGVAAVNPPNPQSWSRYAYALNDPINQTDPLGLEPCSQTKEPALFCGGTDNGGGGIDCTLDGVASFCDIATMAEEQGAAVGCSDNICQGVNSDNLPVEFVATMQGNYYSCMASGCFSTLNAAGQAAVDCTAGEAAVLGLEVGGTINQLSNGQYSWGAVDGLNGPFTPGVFVTGTPGEVDILPNSETVAAFNIEVIPFFGESFGGEDEQTFNDAGLPLYRGTPSGRVLLYDPNDSQQFANGCVLAGPPYPQSFADYVPPCK